MGISRKSDVFLNHRCKVLTAATLSALAAAGLTPGLTQGALIASDKAPLPFSGTIGYMGPVPVQPASVASGNVFDVAVVGLNIAGNSSGGVFVYDAEYLAGPFAPTFGTTYTGTAGGETATVMSSETVSGGITTDKVTVSVPTRFVPVGTTFSDGDLIDDEALEIGLDAGSTPLTFSIPVTTAITSTGSATYRTNKSHTSTFNLSPYIYTMLDPTDTMLSAYEALDFLSVANNAGGTYTVYTPVDGTKYNLSSFSFAFSYNTPTAVPEPGTGMVGLIIGAGLLRRRSRREASPIVALSTGLLDDPVPPGVSDASFSDTGQAGGEMRSVDEERLI